jgi:excisionase family DNA binding protein
MAKMPEMISVADAAEILKITPVRVRQLINAGKIHASMIGKTFVLNRSDVMAHRPGIPGRPKSTDNGHKAAKKPVSRERPLRVDPPEDIP